MNTRRFSLCSMLPFALAACDFTVGAGNHDMQVSLSDMTPTGRYGLVRITGTTTGSSAIATFLDMNQQGAGCLRRSVGECVLYNCAGTSFVAPNPGNLTITGGTPTVTLTPRQDGSYIPYQSSSPTTFLGGQKLTVDAPGQLVPPMHADLTPPNQPFSVTMPDGSRPNIVFTLNRQSDYRLTWTPLGAGSRMHAELNQDTDTNRLQLLECDFDGAAGQGTLPNQLLGGFVLTNPDLTHGATLFIGPSTNASVHTSSGWDISLYAMANGRDAFVNISDN